ncbi:Uncharacterised protein [Enterobacter cloacae]|nr:Uncharacterised protein [Enterobacter cloacae]
MHRTINFGYQLLILVTEYALAVFIQQYVNKQNHIRLFVTQELLRLRQRRGLLAFGELRIYDFPEFHPGIAGRFAQRYICAIPLRDRNTVFCAIGF